MAWRVLEHDGKSWNVSLAAERRPNSPQWNLVFSFRTSTAGQRSIWAAYPLASSSKAALFAQADRISDKELLQLLSEQLT
ncbi:MAG TPA: hypothetical protein VFD73_22370 [Gemmatimonadales bacterium]|jgi:hypothetical protein|nr:hypothetical protein [Gemmatimonadales bacterium]HZI76720.1 hypothetical protein [Gemmatimonadales bacterium]